MIQTAVINRNDASFQGLPVWSENRAVHIQICSKRKQQIKGNKRNHFQKRPKAIHQGLFKEEKLFGLSLNDWLKTHKVTMGK